MPQIPVLDSPSRDFFQHNIQPSRRPALLRNIPIGKCREKWSPDYLVEAVGPQRPVAVHESSTSRLRFLNKNFTYQTLPFEEFIAKVSKSHADGDGDGKYYYYRAVAEDPRSSPSDFRRDFPEIAADFTIPDLLDADSIFSCVFRCGSADLGLWLHYDVVDNVLVQVCGRKRAVLFDPEDADYLYLEGDKSRIFDPENVNPLEFPLFAKATPYVCEMLPGDVLFIPAFWMHYMLSRDFSVAVNVFWFNLPKEIYDAKDTYGNKELQPYFRAAQGVDRAIRQLDILPMDIQRFYARMLRSKFDKFLLSTKSAQITGEPRDTKAVSRIE